MSEKSLLLDSDRKLENILTLGSTSPKCDGSDTGPSSFSWMPFPMSLYYKPPKTLNSVIALSFLPGKSQKYEKFSYYNSQNKSSEFSSHKPRPSHLKNAVSELPIERETPNVGGLIAFHDNQANKFSSGSSPSATFVSKGTKKYACDRRVQEQVRSISIAPSLLQISLKKRNSNKMSWNTNNSNKFFTNKESSSTVWLSGAYTYCHFLLPLFKAINVRRCVLALLAVTVITLFYYTRYVDTGAFVG